MQNTTINTEKLQKKLSDFEEYRKKKNRSLKTFNVIKGILKFVYYPAAGLAILSGILPFLLPFSLPIIILGAAAFITQALLYQYAFKEPDVKFREYFKREIVAFAFKEYFPNYRYSPFKKIDRKKIDYSQIFKEYIHSYYGEDHIVGKCKGVVIEACEVELNTEKTTFKSVASNIFFGSEDDEGDIIQFFKGLYFIADFHKSFEGRALIIPNAVINTGLFKKSSFQGLKKVTMDNVDFDDQFATFSNNEYLTQYLMPPALLNRIVDLQVKYKAKVYLSFVNGLLFLGIDWGKDLLEADINKGISSIDEFKTMMEEIKLFEEIVTHLNLEVRIWGEKAMAAQEA